MCAQVCSGCRRGSNAADVRIPRFWRRAGLRKRTKGGGLRGSEGRVFAQLIMSGLPEGYSHLTNDCFERIGNLRG